MSVSCALPVLLGEGVLSVTFWLSCVWFLSAFGLHCYLPVAFFDCSGVVGIAFCSDVVCLGGLLVDLVTSGWFSILCVCGGGFGPGSHCCDFRVFFRWILLAVLVQIHDLSVFCLRRLWLEWRGGLLLCFEQRLS